MLDRASDVEDVKEYRLDEGWRERSSRTCSHWAGWATDRAVIECQPACAEGHIRECGLSLCGCVFVAVVYMVLGKCLCVSVYICMLISVCKILIYRT